MSPSLLPILTLSKHNFITERHTAVQSAGLRAVVMHSLVSVTNILTATVLSIDDRFK